MHDIWNPWHGCIKYSEGCQNCYMYYLDKIHSNKSGSDIYKTKAKFNYPLSKDKDGNYKVKSGEQIRVSMTSDFFLKQADEWRKDAWRIIDTRKDVVFFILTKRAERIKESLPKNWADGYENVLLNVTCENQARADERIPILLSIPAKHKGIMTAPLLGPINIESYLQSGQIEQVICGGENYENPRPCHYEWVKSLSEQCKKYNVNFTFIETGSNFYKNGKKYFIKDKEIQSKQAFLSKLNYEGKEIDYKLYDEFNNLINKNEIYKPYFQEKCHSCGSKPICNGCSKCGKC